MGRLLFLLLLAPAADPLAWYPLEPGHRWVYDCVSKDGNPRHPEIARWTETITVQERIPTPEGTVVLRKMTIEGNPNPPGGWWWDSIPLLVRGNCIYPLDSNGWNQQTRSFGPDFPAYLKMVSPEFCFPLRKGSHWKGSGDWEWTVEGTGPIARGPRDVPANAIRLHSEQSGSTEYIWFKPSVGPVASWHWHNGTYTEGFEKLRSDLQ